VPALTVVNGVNGGQGPTGSDRGRAPLLATLAGAAGIAPVSSPRWRARRRSSGIRCGASFRAFSVAFERRDGAASNWAGVATQ
jgi:hypothetical protein